MLMTHVLGINLDTKVTRDGGEQNRVGIFGRVLQHFGVVENQGRTLLHMHVLLFCECTPAHVSELMRTGNAAEVLKNINGTLLSTMPDDYFADREKKWANRTHVKCAGLQLSDNPQDQLWQTCGRYQHHYEHKPTCEKGMANPQGVKHCRMAFPRPPAPATAMILLESCPRNDQWPST